MKRADKIRLAQEAAAAAAAADNRDEKERDLARREWGLVRKEAREVYAAKGDWASILNTYRDKEGFYTPEERTKMCRDYSEELIGMMMRDVPQRGRR